MAENPLKCAANAYPNDPFYQIQKSDTEQRYVIYRHDKEFIRKILLDFLDKASGDISIKLRDHEDADNPREVEGTSSPAVLKGIIERYEESLFHDGYLELMLRIPEMTEHLCFDDHGLLFIYTHEDYNSRLKEWGIPFDSERPLICDQSHWHIRPAKGAEQLEALITELMLK